MKDIIHTVCWIHIDFRVDDATGQEHVIITRYYCYSRRELVATDHSLKEII